MLGVVVSEAEMRRGWMIRNGDGRRRRRELPMRRLSKWLRTQQSTDRTGMHGPGTAGESGAAAPYMEGSTCQKKVNE